jgi:hypothetical protein
MRRVIYEGAIERQLHTEVNGLEAFNLAENAFEITWLLKYEEETE